MQLNHNFSDEGQYQMMLSAMQMPPMSDIPGPAPNNPAELSSSLYQNMQSKSIMRSRLEEIFDQQVQEQNLSQ